ncbi:sterol desaturase family protein [Larsenimonas rhizosphaerae]|uniref:Sterol desaturase family protein n=1 Tax=Larsenimonas rhizosphaerae TaxID=2944682 RepID=A0AA42CYQ6_9GAMM|nr:sterol desaturase family protein [Larsenimonas rhizosphaerae]MCM2132212.1 sterol desaturase family protein [Larsenimonas rhizosphaerae]MCX2525473.1 sterol desaturase family protein [Larsenimonas rhizosphaerae]
MAAIGTFILFFAVGLVGMEGVAWFTHRFIMHGPLWCWHRSHHRERQGIFELNDLFAVCFAVPSIALIYLGTTGPLWMLALGLGIAGYGAVYAIFHDGLVHRRFRVPLNRRAPFWRHRIDAHRLHHATSTRDGAVSFGFMVVPSAQRLKAALKRKRAR